MACMTMLMPHMHHVLISPSDEHPPCVLCDETALTPTLSPFVAYVGRELFPLGPDDVGWLCGVRKRQGDIAAQASRAEAGDLSVLWEAYLALQQVCTLPELTP